MDNPQNKRFTFVAPAALNVAVIGIDQESTLAFFVTGQNAILDLVNDPDPGAGLLYTYALWHGSTDTGKRWYSNSVSPLSAGRIRPAPLVLSGGQYQIRATQTLGAVAAVNIIVQLARDIG